MTTISAGAPSIGDFLARLISGDLLDLLQQGTSSTSASTTSAEDSGPATFVTQSDQAKAAAAARGLQAFVESHRIKRTGTSAPGSLQGREYPYGHTGCGHVKRRHEGRGDRGADQNARPAPTPCRRSRPSRLSTLA